MREEWSSGSSAAVYPEQTVAVSNSKIYLKVKRAGDVILASVSGIFLLIPMIIIAIIIKLDSPGPAIYAQERIGWNGKPFTIYKFRSMFVDAEKDGPQWAEKDDKRCTAVGRVLRQSRLDELPQLWNILNGDMSFVGPRPERACFYEKFEQYIPGFKNRLMVQPGLTGWAQINGGYELDPEEKLVYDMEYARFRSVKMDLYCIMKTASLVITHEGAR